MHPSARAYDQISADKSNSIAARRDTCNNIVLTIRFALSPSRLVRLQKDANDKKIKRLLLLILPDFNFYIVQGGSIQNIHRGRTLLRNA